MPAAAQQRTPVIDHHGRDASSTNPETFAPPSLLIISLIFQSPLHKDSKRPFKKYKERNQLLTNYRIHDSGNWIGNDEAAHIKLQILQGIQNILWGGDQPRKQSCPNNGHLCVETGPINPEPSQDSPGPSPDSPNFSLACTESFRRLPLLKDRYIYSLYKGHDYYLILVLTSRWLIQ